MLRNEWFSGTVTLPRPFLPHIGFPIIGNWIAGSAHNGGFECFHIALGADSGFVIWSDLLDLPVFTAYGQDGSTPPPSTLEWYGELDMDPEMKYAASNMLFFTGTDFTGGDIVLGQVGTNGATFGGSSAHFGNGSSNGAFNPFTWRRSAPDCSTNT